jgi:transposase
MRFVMVKSVAQQDLLALHRVRAQLVKSRTALCNQLRGLLRERGVVVRTGAAALKRGLPAALADESSYATATRKTEIRAYLARPSF